MIKKQRRINILVKNIQLKLKILLSTQEYYIDNVTPNYVCMLIMDKFLLLPLFPNEERMGAKPNWKKSIPMPFYDNNPRTTVLFGPFN